MICILMKDAIHGVLWRGNHLLVHMHVILMFLSKEGYDLQTDERYNEWKKIHGVMKGQSSSSTYVGDCLQGKMFLFQLSRMLLTFFCAQYGTKKLLLIFSFLLYLIVEQ